MAHKTTRNGTEMLVSINPATLEPLGEVPLAGPDEVRAAVASAESAFPSWSAMTLDERAAHLLRARDWMLDRVDDICRLINQENGKPRTEALTSEVFLVADLITHYSERARDLLEPKPIPLHNPLFRSIKESRTVYEPLGVVTVVSPWNYPFGIPMSGIVFALLAGNTVVFKPASDVALIGKKIDEILRVGGGLPDGVLNTVIATGASMGTVLFEPPVRKIVFTGSTEVGRKIHQIAAKNFIPTSMELGGKDPMIVCEDADLELAAGGAIWGAFTNCGQVCASVERVYVARPVYDRFVDRVAAKARALRVGPDRDLDVDIGPMANEDQLKIVEEHVRDALAKGARLVHGGRRPDLPGYFFEPTVLADVNHTMKVMRDETFGPVLPIMPFETEDEAIAMANDSLYGLTGSVWTRDRDRGLALARRIQAGTVTVNDHVYTYGLCDTPWQGMKESGMGRSHSDEGFLEFVYPKHLNVDRSPGFLRRRMWWFPYTRAAYEVQKLSVRAFISAKNFPALLVKLATRGDYRKALY